MGALPTAALAEEIETPGEGQVRAFVTLMGNPVLSAPKGKRLAQALGSLDFMVSIDAYINETTRHADVILPSAHPLTQDYISIMYPMWSVRNALRWSPAVLSQSGDPDGGKKSERNGGQNGEGNGENAEKGAWEVIHELSERLGGGATGSAPVDWLIKRARHLGWRWTPTVMANLLLRLGPWGDKFNPLSSGYNLDKVRRATHGLDLGALEEGFQWRLFHRDKKLHLAPSTLLEELKRFAATLDETPSGKELLLIGRRELKSNNSWMHNIPELMDSESRCVLWVNPRDAAARGIGDGDRVAMANGVHSESVPVHITERVREGVVSLPHGYGHRDLGRWQRVAVQHAGHSFNDWSDDREVEAVVAQSVLNGIAVELHPG